MRRLLKQIRYSQQKNPHWNQKFSDKTSRKSRKSRKKRENNKEKTMKTSKFLVRVLDMKLHLQQQKLITYGTSNNLSFIIFLYYIQWVYLNLNLQ